MEWPSELCFRVPNGRAGAELVIKNSVFIGNVARASSPEEAANFIKEIRQRYLDATHHAWAYRITGGPQAVIGFSDDGEPGGTAGRPMLTVLEGQDLREVVAVGTRYFGGIKLGTGGLVRAYSGCIQAALERLPVAEAIYHAVARITVDYPLYGSLAYFLPRQGVLVDEEIFADRVTLTLSVPHHVFDTLAGYLRELTQGAVILSECCIGGRYVQVEQ